MVTLTKGNSIVDYFSGGMTMSGRKTVGGELYRYGYQGEFAETDPETGKPMFQLRLYDPRINRWLTTDPARQYVSPYLSMGNNWVNVVDLDGGFDTWLGALGYWMINGFKGDILKNEEGGFKIAVNNEDGVHLITGSNWEKNNLNKLAFGKELEGSLTFASFIGSETNISFQKVYFPKFQNQVSFYSSLESGPKITTELDISVGVGRNYFVSIYDGDTKNITPEDYAGKYWSVEGSAGVSIVLNPEVNGGYIQSKDIHGGIWRTYYVGASLSIGAQLSTVPFFVNGSVINHYGKQWFLGSKSNATIGTFLLTP